jgi:uncharacterized RDD family membrane protein YckC
MQFHPKDLSELDDLTEEHLGFSALSDGLGFTKNAKKAPQTPAADLDQAADEDLALKKKSVSGTGAVAAGPARPAPANATPLPARPTASVAPSRALPTNVLAEPAAGRLHRMAAFTLDLLIISGPLALAWWFSFGELSLAIFREDVISPISLFTLVFAVYFLLSESFGGQSLGKMILGLRVVEDDKYQKPTGLSHAAKRLALFIVGTALFGLGLLASFWDAKRRPWHDRYSGSIVRKKT